MIHHTENSVYATALKYPHLEKLKSKLQLYHKPESTSTLISIMVIFFKWDNY